MNSFSRVLYFFLVFLKSKSVSFFLGIIFPSTIILSCSNKFEPYYDESNYTSNVEDEETPFQPHFNPPFPSGNSSQKENPMQTKNNSQFKDDEKDEDENEDNQKVEMSPIERERIRKRIFNEVSQLEPVPETTLFHMNEIRKRANSQTVKSNIENPKYDTKNLKTCSLRYVENWQTTKTILSKLGSKDCFNQSQRSLLESYKKEIEDKIGSQSFYKIMPAYHNIQNMISYCREYEFIKDNTLKIEKDTGDKTFSDHMLLHIFGDVFGKGSGLEGMSGFQHLEVRYNILKKYRDNLDKFDYIVNRYQSEPCFDITDVPKQADIGVPPSQDVKKSYLDDLLDHSKTSIELTSKLQAKNYLNFENAYKSALNILRNKDDYFYFQGGWLGHAVIYEVKKEIGDKYTFRVYNSGDGISYHLSSMVLSKSVFLPYIEKINISKDTILSQVFVRTLFDLRDVKDKGNNSNQDILYGVVAKVLDGSLITRPPLLEDLFDPQISGTCAYFSVPYYYKSRSKVRTITNTIELSIQLKYLDEYFEENKQRLKKYPFTYNLAKKSLEYFSESIVSKVNIKSKSIDSGIELLISEKLETYQKLLKDALQEIQAMANKVKNESFSQASSPKGQFEFSKLTIPSPLKGTEYISQTSLSSLEDWVPKPEKLESDLKDFLKTIVPEADSRADTTIQQTAVLNTLKEIILKTPLDDSFWNSVPKEKLSNILYKLRKLNILYVRSVFNHMYYSWHEDRGVTPIEYLTQIKVLTLADIIRSKLYSSEKGIKIPSLFISSIEDYIKGRKILFNLHDIRWSQEFVKIEKYWNKSLTSKNNSDFFSFNANNGWAWKDSRLFFESKDDQKHSSTLHWSKGYGVLPSTLWKSANQVKELLAKNPHKISNKNFIGRTLELLKEEKFGAFLLGKDFYSYRVIQFISEYFTNGSFDKEWIRLYLNKRLSSFNEFLDSSSSSSHWDIKRDVLTHECKEGTISSISYWECDFNFFGIKDLWHTTYPSNKNGIDYYLARSEGELDKTKESVQKLDKTKESVQKNQYIRKRQETNLLVIEGPTEPKITFETFRKLAHLSGSRGMQIIQTLGYFNENPHFLMEDEYRKILKSMILDPGLIELELAENKLLASDLSEFCKTQFKKAKSSGDILLASYFLRLNQYFYESISQLNNKKKLGLSSSLFMNSRQELIEILKSIDELKSKDKVTKDIILRDLIRTFLIEKEFKTNDDVKWYLIASIYRKSFPQSLIINRDIENEIFDIVINKKGLVKSFLNKSQQPLNEVLEYFLKENLEGGTWINSHPVYKFNKKDLKVSININTSKIIIGGGFLESLNPEFSDDPLFRSLIDWNPEKSLKLDGGFEVLSHNGERYRVTHVDGKTVIHRKWGDKWYKYIRESEVLRSTIQYLDQNDPSTNKSSEQALFPGYHHWIEVDGNKDNNGYANIRSESAYKSHSIQKSNNKEVLVFEEKQKNLVSVVFLSWLEDDPYSYSYYLKRLKIDKIVKVSKEGWLTNYELQPVLDRNSNFKFLFGFEHPRYIHVWKSNIDTKIEFPRLKLSLTYNGSDLISEEFGTYEPYIFEDLRTIATFLTFKKGDKLTLLLPRLKLEYPKEESIDEQYLIDYKLAEYQNKLYTYKVTQNKVHASDDSSKLYLAYLHSLNKSYLAANKLLHELTSQLHPWTKEDMETQAWILDVDKDPKSIASGLFSFALALQNKSYFPDLTFIEELKKDKKIKALLSSSFSLYLQQRHRISEEWFPPEYEIWVLDFLKSNFSNDLFFARDMEIKGLQFSDKHILKASKPEIGTNESWRSFASILVYSLVVAESFEPIKQSSLNILKGGLLARNFEDFYNIVYNFRFPIVDSLIKNLFRSLGLETPRNPKLEFKKYLEVIWASGENHYFELARLLLVLIDNVENKRKFLPSWYKSNYRSSSYSTYSSAYSEINKLFKDFEWNPPSNKINWLTPVEFNQKVPSVHKSNIWKKNTNDNKDSKIDIEKELQRAGRLFKNYDLTSPLVSEGTLKEIIRERPLSLGEKSNIQDMSHALDNVFNIEKINQYEEKYFKNIKERIHSRKDKMLSQLRYSIYNINMLKDLVTSLTSLKDKAVESKNSIKTGILEISNKLPETLFEKARHKIQLASTLREDVTLEVLLKYYATQDIVSLFNVNEWLSPQEVEELFREIHTYLLISTYVNKVSELISLSEKIIRNHSHWDEEDSLVQSELLNFVNSCRQVRSYVPNDHPEFLAFEYFMEFLIRKEQIEAIEKLNIRKRRNENSNAKGVLYELIMGAGKTSVLLPLTAVLNQGSDSLSIIVLPEALIPSMSAQLNDQLSNIFGKSIEIVDVKRNYKFDVTQIQTLKERFEDALKQQKVILISNSSIQSLFLLYFDAMRDKRKTDHIRIYQQIFSFLKQYGEATIDEIDFVLNIMRSHRFSLGLPTAMNKDAFMASIGLYNLILSDDSIKNSIKSPFLGTQGREFSKEFYETHVKSKIINRILSENGVKDLFFHGLLPVEADLFKEIDAYQLKKFLNSSDSKTNKTFLDSIENEILKGILATLYTQVHITIPLTWEKQHLIHYGLYPFENCNESSFCPEFIAIPYQSGSPLINSRFGSDLESINYAIQSHLEVKNSFRALKFEFERLRKVYMKAGKKKRKRVLTEARYLFPNISESQFVNMKTEQLNDYTHGIEDSPKKLLRLILYPLRAHLSVFREQLHTNALIYPMIFKSIQGLTGTLWNLNTLPKFYDTVVPSDTLEKTLMLLWQNSSHDVKKLNIFGNEPLEKRVESVLSQRESGSIIDQSGLFRGLENEDVVKEIVLSQSFKASEYNYVIYYDHNHKIKLYSQDGNIKPYSPGVVDRNKVFAFWDLQHTTGSDLKIREHSSAVMIVGKNTILRDLMQAAWRLRNLNKGQSVNFALTQSDYEYIVDYLKSITGRDYISLNLGDLLQYVCFNELDQLNKQTLRSLHFRMSHELVEKVFGHTMDYSKLSFDAFQELFKEVEKLFITRIPEYSYSQYGNPLVSVPSSQDLANENQKIFSKPLLKRLETLIFDKNTLKEKFARIENEGLKILQPVVQSFIESFEQEVEVEMELEMELETETEQEMELEQEIELEKFNKYLKKRDPWPWNKESFFADKCLSHKVKIWDISYPIDESKVTKLPCISLSDALIKDKKHDISKYFDSKLSISLNAAPVYTPLFFPYYKPFSFFSIYQKEFNDVLIVLSRDGVLENITILDRDEAEEIGAWLFEDQSSKKSLYDHSKGYLLYNLGGQFYRWNKNVEKLSSNYESLKLYFDSVKDLPLFIELISQAKFISGRVEYTKKEVEFLKKWMSKSTESILALIEIFENEVLAHRQSSRMDFPDSSLGDLFTELKDKELGLSHFQLVIDTKNGDEFEKSIAIKKMSKLVKGSKGFKEASMILNFILSQDKDPVETQISEDVVKDTLGLAKNLASKGKEISNSISLVYKYLQDERRPISSEATKLFANVLKSEGWAPLLENLQGGVPDSKTELNSIINTVSLMFEIANKNKIKNNDLLDVLWDSFLIKLADNNTLSEYPEFSKILVYFYGNKSFFLDKKNQLKAWSKESYEKSLLRSGRIQRWILQNLPKNEINMKESIALAKVFFESQTSSVSFLGASILKDLLLRKFEGSETLIEEIISKAVYRDKETLEIIEDIKKIISEIKVETVLSNLKENTGSLEKIARVLKGQDKSVSEDLRIANYLLKEELKTTLAQDVDIYSLEFSQFMQVFIKDGRICDELSHQLNEWRSNSHNDGLILAYKIYLWQVVQEWWNQENLHDLIEFSVVNIQNGNSSLRALGYRLLSDMVNLNILEADSAAKGILQLEDIKEDIYEIKKIREYWRKKFNQIFLMSYNFVQSNLKYQS